MHKTPIVMSLFSLAMALSPFTSSHAAELKVLAGGSMTSALNELGKQFEAKTGDKLTIQFDSTPNLIKAATSAPFDLGVVPVDVMKDAGARAKFSAGPTIDIAKVGYGVAVKAGAAKPDVSTADALKQTLLKAQSIATIPESAAGAYVLSVLNKLGIADAVKPKFKVQKATGDIPKAVASGDAEIGVFTMSVLVGPGVEIAGPFPGDLQQDLVFTAAPATDTKNAEAAKALINFLKSPEAIAVLKAKGLTPG
jgi:molybdate transport system substrate-binding protein